MNSRLTLTPLLSLGILTLAGSLAFAQDTPAPPAPSAPAASSETAQPPAPPMRRHFTESERMHDRTVERFHGREDGPMGGGFHMGRGGMWWKNPSVQQRLNLTPDQIKRMDDIFEQSRLRLIDLKANVQKQEVMLEPMLSANPVEMSKAQAQIDKVADARAELEKASAKMLLGLRAVLTPDQWTKLSQRRFGGPGAESQPGPAPQPGSGRPARIHGPVGGAANFMPPPMEP